MSQWSQPGFQYPLQTGFPGAQPQQQFQPGQQLNPAAQFQHHHGSFGAQPGAAGLGAGFGGLTPQPTGFHGARLQSLQQPQQTGFPGAPGVGTSLLQAQPTGFPGAQSSFQQLPPPPPVPPVPPLPASYQQNASRAPPPPPVPQQQASFMNANQNRLGALSASSFAAPSLAAQPTGVGLMSQPTGFAGRALAPLVPQVTGFVDPRLQMMSSSFMPANVSAPYTSGGAPQLAPLLQQQLGGISLQQSFQQYNQAHGRGTAPKFPWALSKAEKKQYDQIFRTWDAQGTGFISGETALEVFGQSGLDKNDLARIWTLADADNRGKLNLAEFHVAMGLIYRRLNGNDIPDELPAELVPPSSRDLDTSVNFLKDILKNDTRARSPSGLDTPVSRLKERSFTSSSSFTQQGGRQDATVYVHDDDEFSGGVYQSRKRHVDRSAVRSRADDASPATSDLSSIKRQLLNTQKMLDDRLANERSSDALDRELEDLRYKITRLQEDLEYVSKGPRTTSKDDERRRLERELVRLMHEEVPELEKKVEEREERRDRQKREWARDRDRRNERSGRFGDDDSGGYSPASRYREEEERPYSRGASRYDRDDRDYDRDRSYRDGDRDRIRDGDRDRGLSTATRTPPPPPPASSPSQPAPPARSPAPAMKNMTPEERQAFIRAEAQRRLEARKQALGVVAPSSAPVASPTLDTTIEDRLAQEKKEAEEKAREAERQADEREKQRREKLEAEKALKGGKTSSPTPTTTAPPPAPALAPVPTPTVKIAPPPPKPRAPVPPPPRKMAVPRIPVVPTPTEVPSPPVSRAPPQPTPVIRTPVPPAPAPAPPAPVVPEEDPEDAALRAREEALRKKHEERAALLRKLEEEEEQARKAEAAYQERRNQFLAAKAVSAVNTTPAVPNSPVPPPAPVPAQPAPSFEEPAEEAVPPPPVPPPPPPPPAPAPVTDKPSNNPFSRLMKEGGGSTPVTPPTATANGSSNPFFRPQTAPPAPPAAPPQSKSPGIPPPVKTTYHTAPKDSDDGWDDVMEKEEDDSSDEEFGTRDTRMGLAQQLFGSLLPSRPQSAAPAPSSGTPIPPAAPAPPSPPPSAPPAPAPSAPAGDRNALLSAIQGGARLRKIVTNDRSGAATSGRVVGDAAPPARVIAVTRSPSPPAAPLMGQSVSFAHGKKESVDWYNSLAVDVDERKVNRLPATVEEAEEEEQADANRVPTIEVSEHAPENGSELIADVDLSIEIRVRSLYPYAGQRDEDLDFDANTIIVAHPSKSGGDWWYGTTVKDGKAGFFPQTYAQRVEQVYAKALYTYESTNVDELAFSEGDTVIIVDRSETDWWKAEHDGLVFVVPAAYLEATEVGLDNNGQSQLDREMSQGQGSLANVDPAGGSDHLDKVTDVYSTPYTSPRDTRRPETSELHRTSSSMNGDEDDEDAYYSLDEEGDSTSEFELEHDPQGERAAAACAVERQRVLEVAGLVVSPLADGEEQGMPPRPHILPSIADEEHDHHHGRHVPCAPPLSAGTRSKSGSSLGLSESLGRKRRPAPAVPPRGLTHLRTKDLPPIPTLDLPATDTSPGPDVLFRSFDTTDKDDDVDEGEVIPARGHVKTSIVHPDDAFERYETFKKMQGSHGHPLSASASRMSMSSFDTGSLAPTSPPKSPASVTPSLRERERESGSGESRASQFLSFLGRHTRSTTPDITERDRKLVISGPIVHAPSPSPVSAPLASGESGPMRADSPVFGSSWASLVDRSALEEIPKEERKRQEAIFELISTEADYVRDVQLIVELFYSRLTEVLDEKATAMIFLNIEDILLTNTTFLSTLEERQRVCRLYIDHIGDLLEKHMPNMGVYLSYCVNQANAGRVLQQMRESSPALAVKLQNLREDRSARNLDLSSYLLVPMQRLTRYPLLIRQILHYTDPCSSQSGAANTRSDVAERRSIFAALQTAEGILEEVNETIRDREGIDRLGEISRALWIGQGRLDLTAPTRHLGPRKLVKEGVLSKAKSGRKLRVVLCNDILVLLNEADKGLYRVPIPVNEIQIKSSRTGREDPLIRLHLAYPRGGGTIVLRASNVREANIWKDAILDADKKAQEGIRNMVREPGEL